MLDLTKDAIKNAEANGEISLNGLKAGKASIKVIGIGGCGDNAVSWLHNKGIFGADTYIVNTDAQQLEVNKADHKILIGRELTRGLGAGGDPKKAKEAARESLSELKRAVSDADMIFLVAGMGGGTGTGVTPIVAQLAQETGALVLGTVTMPFDSEKARIDKAEFGLQELRDFVNTAIVIDNNKLVEVAGQLPLMQAFAVGNELMSTMIKGLVETITVPGLINLDFADIQTIMKNGEMAVVGIGEDSGTNRVEEATRMALTHPLLDVDYKNATGALIQVTGGNDLKLEELTRIGDIVGKNLAPDAQAIWGTTINKDFDGKVRVITIMTGVKSPYILGRQASKELIPQLEMSDLGIEVFKS